MYFPAGCILKSRLDVTRTLDDNFRFTRERARGNEFDNTKKSLHNFLFTFILNTDGRVFRGMDRYVLVVSFNQEEDKCAKGTLTIAL